jgi:outer membrane murein-binding lipoprotein Lpp
MKLRWTYVLGAFFALLLLATKVPAQNAQEVVIELQKIKTNAFTCTYPQLKDLMDYTIADKLKKAGIGKGKKQRGFIQYAGVVLPQLSPNQLDIYIKVEGQGNSSVVYLLLATGYDNFISSGTDASVAANAIQFLSQLVEDAVLMKKNMDVNKQASVVQLLSAQIAQLEAKKEKQVKKLRSVQKEYDRVVREQDKMTQQLMAEKDRLASLQRLITP